MSHPPAPAGSSYQLEGEGNDPGQGLICLTEADKATFQTSMSTFLNCYHASFPSSNGVDAPEWAFESAHLNLIRRELVRKCLDPETAPPVIGITKAGPSELSAAALSGDDPRLVISVENPLRPCQKPETTNRVIFDQGEKACSRCQRPKESVQQCFSFRQCLDALVKPDQRNPFLFLNDFHPKFERPRCCRKCVCAACWKDSLSSPFRGAWSASLDKSDIDNHTWLRCPACNSPLSSQYRDHRNVLQLMQAVDLEDAEFHAGQFEEANRLRSVLLGAASSIASTRQDKHARLLEESLRFHDGLIKRKLIRPYLRTCRDDAIYPPVQISPHAVIRNGRTGNSDVVLVLEHLFQACVPRDCDICAETYLEYDNSDGRLWAKAFQALGFGIDVWPGMKILHFPSPAQLPDCRHNLSICTSCMGKYIRAETEKGEACVENIECLHPDCEHRLTEREVEHLAKPVVVSQYQRLSFLKAVGPMPENFRQCLKEGCYAGGLYEMHASPFVSAQSPSRYRITCSECGFAMCYLHQTPWHRGQTCAEFDEQRARADQWSNEYVANNTKPCPSCGAPIEKGDGCFHMTCRSVGCGHQFCWECRADWEPIEALDSLGWEAHREGCIFRSQKVPPPYAVQGVNAADAVARFRERVIRRIRRRRAQAEGVEQDGEPQADPRRLRAE